MRMPIRRKRHRAAIESGSYFERPALTNAHNIGEIACGVTRRLPTSITAEAHRLGTRPREPDVGSRASTRF